MYLSPLLGRYKTSETLLGIETEKNFMMIFPLKILRYKTSETLLGIETLRSPVAIPQAQATKPLKPF